MTKKRLYRSRKEKIIAGVCGGIAEYLDVDPTIVRLIWVIITIIPPFIFAGVLGYLIAWLIIPEKPKGM